MKNLSQASSGQRFEIERAGAPNQNVGQYERIASGMAGAALIVLGLQRRSIGGVLTALGGAAMLYRGASGHCPAYQRFGIDTTREGLSRGISVERAITIGRSPEEVYRFWRNLENLPSFMQHLQSVTEMPDGRTHWVAQEAGIDIDWYAQIIEDVPGERISWRSEPGGRVETDGEVIFRQAPGNRGTEVYVRMHISGPGRALAMSLAPLLRRFTRMQVGQDLRRLKQLIETGEITTGAMRNDQLRGERQALPSNQRMFADMEQEDQGERRVYGSEQNQPMGTMGSTRRNGQGVQP